MFGGYALQIEYGTDRSVSSAVEVGRGLNVLQQCIVTRCLIRMPFVISPPPRGPQNVHPRPGGCAKAAMQSRKIKVCQLPLTNERMLDDKDKKGLVISLGVVVDVARF